MKIINTLKFAALAAVGFTLATQPAIGQAPAISSFGQNGQLVCTNLQPSSTASVEWASSALGPWTNNWAGLESVTANSNGMIQVGVPMFYRVRGTPPLPLGNVTFTKWKTALNPRPGVVADMAGVIVGGDVGDGTFTGEVLSSVVDPVTGVTTTEAVYHVHGSLHSFDARIQAVQQVAGVGQKGVITGVVTDGWLQGHAVAGEWTVIPPCGYGGGVGIGNCFAVTLDILK